MMWRLTAIGALAVLLSTVPHAARADGPGSRPTGACASDELFVKLRPGADPNVVILGRGASIRSTITFIEVYVVSIPAGSAAEKISEFQADPAVEYAEPNAIARIPESPPNGSEGCDP